MPAVEFLNGARAHEQISITESRFVIGRGKGCELVIDDVRASREHVAITEDGAGVFWIEDQQSENGTRVNARCISRQRLEHGDVVAIGQVELRFVDNRAVVAAEAAQQTIVSAEVVPETPMPVSTDAEVAARPETEMETLAGQILERDREIARLREQLARERTVAHEAQPGGELMRLPHQLLARVLNPRLRMTFPHGGPEAAGGRPAEVSTLRWSFLGIGREGDLWGANLLELDRQPVRVVVEELVPEARLSTPARSLVRVGDDGVLQDLGEELQNHAGDLRDLLAVNGHPITDLFVLGSLGVFGTGGEPVRHLAMLCAALGIAPSRAGSIRLQVFVSLTDLSLSEGLVECLDTWRDLCATSAVTTALLLDTEHLRGFGHRHLLSDNGIAATVAGALDSLERLVGVPPLLGRWTPGDLEEVFATGGLGSLGIAACTGTDDDTIQATIERSLTEGFFMPRAGQALARAVALVAVLGAELVEADPELPRRVFDVLDTRCRTFPQARYHAAVFEDSGSSMRVLSAVIGLTPGSLVPGAARSHQ